MSNQISFPVHSFRNLETPMRALGYMDYYAVVKVQDLPDLSDWRKINVRDPKMAGKVPDAIREGFNEKRDLFLLMNRGIVLSADKVYFDQAKSHLKLIMSNPNVHGLLDGGHTYNIIREQMKPDVDQFVKIEILEGLSAEEITDVVEARNTSNQVKDESLMNLQGDFDQLGTFLKRAPYYNDIAFKEYETYDNGDPKPIDIREIIAILTAFDRDNFNESTHPINAYRSKAACLTHFADNKKSYKKLYPLANEILDLYDLIQEKLPGLDNTARGRSGDVSRGAFGKLTGVSYRDGKLFNSLKYLKRKSKYGVPAGFVFPILGAFRALLEESNGGYVWGKGLDPKGLLDGDLGTELAETIGSFAAEHQNPSKTGKSLNVWKSCYQAARVFYLQTK